jgi:HSP20 family protein
MSIIKWAPFLEPFEELDKEFSSLTPAVSGFTPAVDLYQTKDDVVVETPLAGVDPEKVDIAIENDVLTIQGKSEKKSEVDEKNYYRKEVRYGSFFRSVAMPTHVLGDKAKAEYENGMLKITIPKAPEAKAKKIAIKAKTRK